MALPRRLALLALSAVFAVSGMTLGASTALASPPDSHTATRVAAEDGYVYWGYYLWDEAKSTWTFATVGAADTKNPPADGDVVGFRWGLTLADPRPPRAAGDFAELCGDEEAGDGEKRVGVVIDYGTGQDAQGSDKTPAPRGDCAVVDESFTTQQALQSVADVRVGGGLICGLDGYPSSGCSVTVKNASQPPADKPVELETGDDAASASTDGEGDGMSTGLMVAIALAVAAGLGGAVLSKRRS